MEFGLIQLVQVLGALAFFIFGMKVMSEGIQLAAGSQLRNILRTMTKNRYMGVFTGFLTTAAVQSSSATTVMTVSFVNAGLISLVESAGIMMGANIGTTITGWLVSILGFKVKLHFFSLPLMAIGVPMLFSKGKYKHWGEFIIGFSILFLGLSFLKDSVPDLKNNPEVLEFLARFSNWGIFSRLIFVLVGAVLTILVQSSSAAMTLTLTMCLNGWLPFEIGAAMILGENIGTTITAELASLVGNTEAKRSARIHSLFNLIGVSWMLIAMPFVLDALSYFLQNVLGLADPYSTAASVPIAISAFHTTFNLLNVFILIWFVPALVDVARRTVKSGDEDSDFKNQIEYFNNIIKTPELSILELQKGIAKYGEITSRMLEFIEELAMSVNEKEQNELLKRIEKYEEITDRMEIEMTDYITKMSSFESSNATSVRMRSLLSICNDLERIGDAIYQMSKNVEKKISKKRWFNEDQRDQLSRLIQVVRKGFDIMVHNLSDFNKIDLEPAITIRKEIGKLCKNMRKENTRKLVDPDYNHKTAMLYMDLFAQLESIGEHQLAITEAAKGEV